MDIEEQLKKFLDRRPTIHPSAFVAPGAVVIGDVHLAENSSIWYGAVLRGDINSIRIGVGSNIQDGAVVHLADDYGVEVGAHVTCGHAAVLHACSVGDEVLIGMGAIILDGATIGEQSIVGAHALVKKGMVVPPGSLVLGSPAKIVRALDEAERAAIKPWAEKYVGVSRGFLARGLGAPGIGRSSPSGGVSGGVD
jgi:carbonic anhydrase/acetyltransferase-like protein (isoleucine patch superfamily)